MELGANLVAQARANRLQAARLRRLALTKKELRDRATFFEDAVQLETEAARLEQDAGLVEPSQFAGCLPEQTSASRATSGDSGPG